MQWPILRGSCKCKQVGPQRQRRQPMAHMKSAHIHNGLVALVLLLSLGATAACSSTGSGHVAHSPQQASYPSVNVHIEADRYEYTSPQSMCPSVLTSVVVVESHGQPRWNTPDGQRPTISNSNMIVAHGYRIYTPVLFAQNHPLIDHRPAPTKEFMQIGGQVGSDTMFIDPYPQLKDGGHYVIVFAPDRLPASQGKTADWLVVFDAFPVDDQGMVLLQAAGSPNEPGPGQPQPEIKISLTSLKQQLAACR